MKYVGICTSISFLDKNNYDCKDKLQIQLHVYTRHFVGSQNNNVLKQDRLNEILIASNAFTFTKDVWPFFSRLFKNK